MLNKEKINVASVPIPDDEFTPQIRDEIVCEGVTRALEELGYHNLKISLHRDVYGVKFIVADYDPKPEVFLK